MSSEFHKTSINIKALSLGETKHLPLPADLHSYSLKPPDWAEGTNRKQTELFAAVPRGPRRCTHMVPASSSLPWHCAASHSTARAPLNTQFYLVMQEAKGEGKEGGRGKECK